MKARFLLLLLCISLISCQPAAPQVIEVETIKPVEVEVPVVVEVVVTATPEALMGSAVLECQYIGHAVTMCIHRTVGVLLYSNSSGGLAAVPIKDTKLK